MYSLVFLKSVRIPGILLFSQLICMVCGCKGPGVDQVEFISLVNPGFNIACSMSLIFLSAHFKHCGGFIFSYVFNHFT